MYAHLGVARRAGEVQLVVNSSGKDAESDGENSDASATHHADSNNKG
jgi:hypothetical protein